MEASYAALYRALGAPATEQYDMAYRRLRWACGCVATGITSQKMLVKRCLRHHHISIDDNIGFRR
ncbi:MAG TPA: hypothetical protein VIJ64_01385 [Candidatus Lustribacter sp.]